MDKWINEETLKTPDDGGDGKLDRISALPDAILCHILSFLPGTKQSAGTSILSSRWRYLFASLRDIDLISTYSMEGQTHASRLNKNSKFDVRRVSDLINFGNRLIQLRNGMPVRRFRLSVVCDAKYHEALLTLISAALSCKVQELEIFAESYIRDCVYRFPHDAIFTCKTLVSFKLYWPNLDLKVPESIYLPNLKALYLARLRLVDGDSFQRLIHGCPFLEQLFCSLYSLIYLNRQNRNLKVFRISNPLLKKLTLKVSRGSEFTLIAESNNLESFHYKVYGSTCERKFTVTINAPNLKYLCYKGPVDGVDFIQSSKSLVRVEFLVCFCINCRIPTQDVFAFLDKVQSVESLYLTEHILQVLHHLPMLPTFENLKRLEVEPMYDIQLDHIQSWKNLQSLTENAPNLEVLVFDHVYRSICIANGLPEMIPKCCIQHLQEVEITNFHGNKHDFRLVEYLLQNGKALKKITLGGYHQEIQRSLRRRKSIKCISHGCQIVVAKPQDMMKANICYYM